MTYILKMKHKKSRTKHYPHHLPRLMAISDHPRVEVRSAVWHGVCQDSNQFPVPGHEECRGRQVLSHIHSLALSKWTDGATHCSWQIPETNKPL